MNITLLQTRFSSQEIDSLMREFPQFLFLTYPQLSYKKLENEQWDRIEILFGNQLTVEELNKAHHLRWIHSPSPQLNQLCLTEILERGNILVTTTLEENTTQIGEFVLAGILAFAKNLFHWKDVNHFPHLVWDSKWRDSMWSLPHRLLLQIGLDRVGTEICRVSRNMHMKVWGVESKRSFNPYCHKTFSIQELHSTLPQADVVCLTLPKHKAYENWFKKKEFDLMKEDSILIVLGSAKVVKEEDLKAAVQSGKLRGVILDVNYQLPLSFQSPLWNLPNVLITPEIAPRPKAYKRESLSDFKYNLRQYVHNNFKDMKILVN